MSELRHPMNKRLLKQVPQSDEGAEGRWAWCRGCVCAIGQDGCLFWAGELPCTGLTVLKYADGDQ
jgi:hypothetical protein